MQTKQAPSYLGISADILTILRCPTCRSTLAEQESRLVCCSCTQCFPFERGILRFVSAENYAGTFGFQWKRHARTQLDHDGNTESEKDFRARTGFVPQEMAGKLVLDVGCGMGRFAEVVSRWGARVVAVDLSNAAEVANQNLSDRRSVTCFQADLFSLPFAPGSFDYIYSLGVLHHTPDCEKAFKVLPDLLKPGGTIAIWVYSGYNKWYRFSDVYRNFTHLLPAKCLHALCHVAVPLYYVHQGLRRLPIVGRPISGLLHHVLPVCMHPDPEVRVLDTFDWYSPKYQSKHTYEEVFRWFRSCSLDSLLVLEQPIAVRGRKPFQRVQSCVKEETCLSASQVSGASGEKTLHGDELAHDEDRAVDEREGFCRKLGSTFRWLPGYAWQRLARSASSNSHTHLIIALADHFEPGILPHTNGKRAAREVQEHRLERWCREYPKAVCDWPDSDGKPFCHTYFYPAEQYDKGLIDRLVGHCKNGWGEIEIHLHHGVEVPDTVENTRRQLLEFRDVLAAHGCMSQEGGQGTPQYAFVHGNFALANSANGIGCGIDNEMQILSETGCYADFTLPSAPHVSQIAKVNSLYECALPLGRRAPHRRGKNLERGRAPHIFPLIVQGPLMVDIGRRKWGLPFLGIENGTLTAAYPPTMQRLQLWRKASIRVSGQPDWIFIKLSCHGMDPRDEDAMFGSSIQKFLRDLAGEVRNSPLRIHFVSAREMVNIILAACDGREGNPQDFRDYRFTLLDRRPRPSVDYYRQETSLKGI